MDKTEIVHRPAGIWFDRSGANANGASLKIRNPDEILLVEERADEVVEADKTICCLDCDRYQGDWEVFQREPFHQPIG